MSKNTQRVPQPRRFPPIAQSKPTQMVSVFDPKEDGRDFPNRATHAELRIAGRAPPTTLKRTDFPVRHETDTRKPPIGARPSGPVVRRKSQTQKPRPKNGQTYEEGASHPAESGGGASFGGSSNTPSRIPRTKGPQSNRTSFSGFRYDANHPLSSKKIKRNSKASKNKNSKKLGRKSKLSKKRSSKKLKRKSVKKTKRVNKPRM